MTNKEYTYDIDKYTIGVDENGEDGIGLTIAIIKNGKINFLGNCYGEKARCIDLLIKENAELKSQLRGTTHCFDEEEHNKLKEEITNLSKDVDMWNDKYNDMFDENRMLKKQLEEWEHHLKCSKEMLDIQGKKGNYDYDEYMLGLYNGMEYIIALFETREPNYINGKDVEFTNNKTQQKEFIKWLEDEINKLKEQIKNYDIWHEVGTDINFLIFKKQFYLEILQKYKNIIGDDAL